MYIVRYLNWEVYLTSVYYEVQKNDNWTKNIEFQLPFELPILLQIEIEVNLVLIEMQINYQKKQKSRRWKPKHSLHLFSAQKMLRYEDVYCLTDDYLVYSSTLVSGRLLADHSSWI